MDKVESLRGAVDMRLVRAAKRILGDTSDSVWCDNDDDVNNDEKILAKGFLGYRDELGVRMTQIEGMKARLCTAEFMVEELESKLIDCRNGVLQD
jgi:hypothetical protein